MKAHGVKNIVFSSSATVYGDPAYLPLDEKHPVGGCTNPYGKSKYFIEEMIKDLCKAEPVRKQNRMQRRLSLSNALPHLHTHLCLDLSVLLSPGLERHPLAVFQPHWSTQVREDRGRPPRHPEQLNALCGPGTPPPHKATPF